jgi:hypothetical protein
VTDSTSILSAAALLDGLPGRPGFVFHDGHNRPVHQAAPGLLGLLESRYVIERWKPQILRWLDGTEHFFHHLCAELADEPSFEPIGREIEDVLGLDAPLPVRNQFLFQYLHAATRGLERSTLDRVPGVHVGAGAPPHSISLNGPWSVRYRQRNGAYIDGTMNLPVNWELVPGIDNYAGTMRFTRRLTLDPTLRDAELYLRFWGVDYFADLWTNGHYVGGHEGCFGPFKLDVGPYLRFDQDNILRLTVTSPNDPAGPGTHVTSGWGDFSPSSSFPNRKTLVKGTLGHHDAKRGGAWSSLTSQDGNTGGVWNDVELLVLGRAHFTLHTTRISTHSVRPTTPDGDEGRVGVNVETTIRNTTHSLIDARLRVRAQPANFDGRAYEFTRDVLLRPGTNEVACVEKLAPVRLWMPRDHGFPHLYSVTVTIEVGDEVLDRATVETGFRTLAVSPIGESDGPDGAFVVNGTALFVRGTNLLPTYWLSEYSTERIERDFDLLEQAGFNAVLVHNLVLPRRFYAEADRRGFLVVQMFPLQWTYEQSGEFLARAKQQIGEMADLLANHPSIVSYEVHNEPDMRTFEDLDNRVMDFDLHTVLREVDPTRWVTTYSSGNHAYPGQFYPMRDDNSFATLPARFLEEEYNGRRISRHRNMPTEFGIQAMPNVELVRELLSEGRMRQVLERIRTDPKWLATGAERWEEAEKTLEEAKAVLGDGGLDKALAALDWSHLWDMGGIGERVRDLEATASEGDHERPRTLVSLKLALLVLEVLHYGGFKGENFWFGLWRPGTSLEDFVRSSQDRQYRLHKDAIEHYLNAGVTGPIVGYFSFMFRDADWQAPTWGVVDAAWVPKKAYRAYLESNAPMRVTLPAVLRSAVKVPGDAWVPEADVIVANQSSRSLPGARVTVWVEDAAGSRLTPQTGFTVDLRPRTGWKGLLADAEWTVAGDAPPGTYFVKAAVATGGGETLSTNSYEIVVLDVGDEDLLRLTKADVKRLLDGAGHHTGFHYWHHGSVVYRARPGIRGFVRGFGQAEQLGIDLYETIQGEHLIRHVLGELESLPYGRGVVDDVWRIRSEIVSPAEKARVLLRYLKRFVEKAEVRLAMTTRGGRAHKPQPPR